MTNTEVIKIKEKQPEGKLEKILNMFNICSKPTVSVINLQGIVGSRSKMQSGISLQSVNNSIETAFKPKNLSAVCLIINSPGGSPVQSELIAQRIRMLAKERKVCVYSFIEDVGASGGYWLACAGDYIYSSLNSIIGSIGVISSGFGLKSAIEKLGIQRRIYTSGDSKSVLDPFQDEDPKDIEMIKGIQNDIHKVFIEYVKVRRNNRLKGSYDELFDGKFWTGKDALNLGLIDGIDNMYSFIENNFPKSKIFMTTPKKSWIKEKLGLYFNVPSAINQYASSAIEHFDNKVKHSKYDMF